MELYRLLGAFTSGLVDAVLEGIYVSNPEYYSGKFPYVPTIGPLPPADDWIVFGVSLAPWLAGKYMKRKALEEFGEGALLYSGPMMLHHTIVRGVSMMRGSPMQTYPALRKVSEGQIRKPRFH
jgi:hypothetical protein